MTTREAQAVTASPLAAGAALHRHRSRPAEVAGLHPATPSSSRKLATGLSTFQIESNILVQKALTPKTRWTVVYDYRNRWYLPETGVFGERDPFELSGLPNLYTAFAASPYENGDPFGEWNFDFSSLANSQSYLASIEDIKKKAQVLLFARPTKRYLRFRFGTTVNDEYLRRVSRDGTPPRIVFNAGEVEGSGGFAFYRNGTIYLKPYFAQAEERAANMVNWEHPKMAARLLEAVQWSMAVTLVHETIHFMDHDIDGEAAVDARAPGYDIGDKWEYYLFGKHGISWGPPHYLDATNAVQFLRFLDWVEVAQHRKLQRRNADLLAARWSRIVRLLAYQREQSEPLYKSRLRR
jgi:RHS repeat-associated protein